MIAKEKNFTLENFEGPLDLLLHLIREKKLNLLEISLVKVADQFIEFVIKNKNFNLDIASEYLLIASQLIDMKSKFLMKSEIFTEPSVYDDIDQENLLERLIIYEKFKKLSDGLLDVYHNAPGFEKLDDDFIPYMEEEGERIISLISNGTPDLIKAWKNIVVRLENTKPLETRLKVRKISIEQRKKELEEIIEKRDTTFLSIIDNPSKYYMAITLLVLLELSNEGRVILVQTNENTDIEIRRRHEQ